MLKVKLTLYPDAKTFLKAFNEAKEFNLALNNGSKDLKFVPIITEKDNEKKPEEKKVEEVKVETKVAK